MSIYSILFYILYIYTLYIKYDFFQLLKTIYWLFFISLLLLHILCLSVARDNSQGGELKSFLKFDWARTCHVTVSEYMYILFSFCIVR